MCVQDCSHVKSFQYIVDVRGLINEDLALLPVSMYPKNISNRASLRFFEPKSLISCVVASSLSSFLSYRWKEVVDHLHKL